MNNLKRSNNKLFMNFLFFQHLEVMVAAFDIRSACHLRVPILYSFIKVKVI